MTQHLHLLTVACLVGASLALAQEPAAKAVPDYAIVVSTATAGDPAWSPVVKELAAKHTASILPYSVSAEEALPELRKQFPRHVCFVARPEEATRKFVAQVHQLTRRMDEDPYTDCFWGILTGHDAANALRIVRQSEPLTIRRVASATPLTMDMVEEGLWYSELDKNKMVRKEKGGQPVELKGPDDTTQALVDTLNDYHADLFVASGHATEHDWMIGFRYKNGFFKHDKGQLFGVDTAGKRIKVDSSNPKVYMPVGNCLMGNIPGPDCMATSWMNSANVCQMLGYTVETWYGYGGWGVLDYFVEQPGRYTFTEAFFANQIALEHRLATYFPDFLDSKAETPQSPAPPVLHDAAKAAGLTMQDGMGLRYDLDTVAFYGDPAWSARMAQQPRAFEQTLTRENDRYTFEITPKRGADSFKPVNTNGSQRGGRPFIVWLPERLAEEAQVIEGAELHPVINDRFILVPNPGVCDPAKPYRVVFSAQ